MFFDFETTGLDTSQCRVIEMAAVVPGTGASFSTLVNPHIGFSGAGAEKGKSGIVEVEHVITGLTGITDADVQAEGVPGIADAITQLEAFIAAQEPGQGVVLVAHNSKKFDVPAGARVSPDWERRSQQLAVLRHPVFLSRGFRGLGAPCPAQGRVRFLQP